MEIDFGRQFEILDTLCQEASTWVFLMYRLQFCTELSLVSCSPSCTFHPLPLASHLFVSQVSAGCWQESPAPCCGNLWRGLGLNWMASWHGSCLLPEWGILERAQKKLRCFSVLKLHTIVSATFYSTEAVVAFSPQHKGKRTRLHFLKYQKICGHILFKQWGESLSPPQPPS